MCQYGELSANVLKKEKFDVEWNTYPGMGHAQCTQEYIDMQRFIWKLLPAKSVITKVEKVEKSAKV